MKISCSDPVTDYAGNVTTSVHGYTLDSSSDHTPPALTLYWPQSGARLSGSSFTLRGSLDDPTATVTASIVDGSGATTALSGLVERNGLLWVEDLPLSTGTHTLTLTMTDANNNISTSILALEASTVVVTIDDFSAADLNQPTIPTVSGTINTPGYAVWVNGVRATINPNGTWIAADVPLPAGGTAVVQARASANCENGEGSTPTYLNLANPPCPGPIDAERQIEKPPFLYASSYRESWSQEIFYEDLWPRDYPESQNYTLTWLFGQGGDGRYDAYFEPWQNYPPPPTPGPNHDYRTETWPLDSNWEPTLPVSVVPGDDYYGLGEPYQMPPAIPLEHCHVIDRFDGPAFDDIYARSAQTGLKLRTGGKAGVQHKNLFTLSGSADEIKDKRWQPRMGPPVPFEAIPPGQVQIGQLGPLGNDGLLYKVLPDNQTLDVTPRVKNKKYYQFTVSPQKHKLIIAANNIPLAPDRVATARFCVGMKISFTYALMPESGSITDESCVWQLSSKVVNELWRKQRWVPADPSGFWVEYGSSNYRLNPALLLNKTPSAWWLSCERPTETLSAKVAIRFEFSNGQLVFIDATGLLSMFRPSTIGFSPAGNPHPSLSPTSSPNMLQLGDEFGNGAMMFVVTVDSGPFSGLANLVQLIRADRAATGGAAGKSSSTSGEYWLDNDLFYFEENDDTGSKLLCEPGSPGFLNFSDQPGYELVFGTSVCAIEDSFKDYIVFRPTGDPENIYVTLGRSFWDWYATANKVSGSWTISMGAANGPSAPDSSDEAATWEEIYNNWP